MDPAIPRTYVKCPPVSLDGNDPGVEALRVCSSSEPESMWASRPSLTTHSVSVQSYEVLLSRRLPALEVSRSQATHHGKHSAQRT